MGQANRSLQSGSSAAADGGNTRANGATREGSGPLDVSALADAVANVFGDQLEANGNGQNDPAGAGQSATEGSDLNVAGADDANSDAVAGDGHAPEEGSERHLPGEGNESEAGGEGGDGDQNQDQDGADGSESADGAGESDESEEAANGQQLPKGVQKRIGQLIAKVRELEQKLAARTPGEGTGPTAPGKGTGPTGLDSVMDLGELQRREVDAEEVLADVDPLITRLAFAPQQVEAKLRAAGAKLVNERGEDDFSVERMADTLLALKSKSQAILKAAPARRAWLQNHAQAHAQALKVYPWLNDAEDSRNTQVQQILQQFPGLRAAPNFEYWVASALEGHLATQRRLKPQTQNSKVLPGRGNGQNGGNATATRTQNGVRRGLPNSGAGAGGGPRVAPDAKKRAEAKAKVLKSGTVEALAEFMEGLPGLGN